MRQFQKVSNNEFVFNFMYFKLSIKNFGGTYQF